MSIDTSINLNDRMSPALISMINSINRVISSLKKVDGVDLQEIHRAQDTLNRGTRNLVEEMNNLQREVQDTTNDFVNLGNNGNRQMNGLIDKIKKMAITFGGLYGAKKALDLSDNITTMDARLKLNLDKGQTIKDLKEQIFQMSQDSRGDFLINVDAVAKLKTLASDAFSSNSEIIKFQELLNKQMTIGGASEMAKQSTVLQLTQAMASGRLQGDEYRSLSENNPLLIKAIATSLKISRGELKKMSSEGLITAEIIKKAMFDSAKSINEQFKTMPITFGQTMTKMKNKFIMNFSPVAQALSKIINSGSFMQSINIISTGLGAMVVILAKIISVFGGLSNIIKNNFEIILPVIALGIIGWGAYAIAINSATIATKVNAIAQWASTTAIAVKNTALLVGAGIMALFTSATIAQTAAQWGINTALYACPIVWIIAGILGIVTMVYLLIGVINKWAGTTYSATGFIIGAFSAVFTTLYNGVIFILNVTSMFGTNLYNHFAFVAETLGNIFKNPVITIKRLFFDMSSFILNKILNVAKVMDQVLGTSYADKIKDLSDNIQKFADDKIGKKEFKIERKVAKTFEYKNVVDSFKGGYGAGKNIGNSVAEIKNKANYFMAGNTTADLLKNIDRNTAGTSKGIDLTKEEIKYMRDVAEQEIINRYTTASITNNNSFQNSIGNNLDIDSVITTFADGIHKASEMVAHGSY